MQIFENVPLAPLTTLHIGGSARYLAQIDNEEDLLEAIRFALANSLRMYPLGGGSNLVIPDEGYPGLILHMTIEDEAGRTDDYSYVESSAGESWDAFVLTVCEQGISGIECLAGIPGLVGGSPIQNIGAYGQEVASTIRSVHALDLQTLKFVDIPHEACGFAYRTSIFNSTHRSRYVITRVDFHFDPEAKLSLTYADLAPLRGTDPTPLDVYHAVRAIRDRKAMVIHPGIDDPNTRSAGSFFKNPIVPTATLQHIAQTLSIPPETIPNWPVDPTKTKIPAAWLIEQAGFPKGYAQSPQAPVAISELHTLALVNRSGTATCADLLQLRDHITVGVQTRFEVTLEQEPVTLTP